MFELGKETTVTIGFIVFIALAVIAFVKFTSWLSSKTADKAKQEAEFKTQISTKVQAIEKELEAVKKKDSREGEAAMNRHSEYQGKLIKLESEVGQIPNINKELQNLKEGQIKTFEAFGKALEGISKIQQTQQIMSEKLAAIEGEIKGLSRL